MTPYRTINCLPVAAAAYLAGLVDGEGTITLTRLHRNENRRLALSISNNELPLLKFVAAAVGAGRITRKRTYSSRHAPSFAYQISSRQALDLLKQITPHLRSYKRARADLALREYLALTPRNGRYTPETKKAREEFASQLLLIRP